MREFSEFCNKLLETLDERGGSYGLPENSFECIALYWSVYLDKIITETDVAILMMLLKIARETEKHKDDNFLDIAGYAACATCLNKKED
jgi:hypothetical protein